MNDVVIRKLQQQDNKAIASIIRQGLLDFDAAKPGTVFYDSTTDDLFTVFKKEKSFYFIAEYGAVIAGGAGVYPTAGLPEYTCELVKLYLHKNYRGRGFGKLLLQKCINAAIELGYKKMYLETMPELKSAIPLYEKNGFVYLKGAMGNSGHSGCDVWMIKDLQ